MIRRTAPPPSPAGPAPGTRRHTPTIRHARRKLVTLVLALAIISVVIPVTVAGRHRPDTDATSLRFDTAAPEDMTANAGDPESPEALAGLELSDHFTPDATYVQHEHRHRTGPAWERCRQGRTTVGPDDYTRRHFAFRDKTTQAYYWAHTDGFYHDAGYYAENTEVEVVWWDFVFTNVEWDLELRDTQKTATPVDHNGRPTSLAEALKPKTIDGQQVIETYWKYRSSSVPKNNFCFVGEQAYVRRVNAVDSKKELVHQVYLDGISDDNLTEESTYRYGYGTGPFSTYEPSFIAAGWDKAEARKRGDETVKNVMDAGGPAVQGQGGMR